MALDLTPDNQMMWWWLSFADDTGAKGVCIVQGESFLAAVEQVHRLEICPGGEVLGFELPDDSQELRDLPVNVLLSPAQVKAAQARELKELSDEERSALDLDA